MTENAISKNNGLDRCNTFSLFHIYTEEHVVNQNIFFVSTGADSSRLQNYKIAKIL